jgi:hypothetical protein
VIFAPYQMDVAQAHEAPDVLRVDVERGLEGDQGARQRRLVLRVSEQMGWACQSANMHFWLIQRYGTGGRSPACTLWRATQACRPARRPCRRQ